MVVSCHEVLGDEPGSSVVLLTAKPSLEPLLASSMCCFEQKLAYTIDCLFFTFFLFSIYVYLSIFM